MPTPTPTVSRKTFFVKAGERPEEAMRALAASLLPGDYLAYDVETTACHPSDPRDALTSIQLGSRNVAVLLDPADPAHCEAARVALADTRFPLTAHNAGFDILRLVRAGVFPSVREAWSRTTDTLICGILMLGRAKSAHTPDLDLKNLTRSMCGDDAVSKDAKDNLRKLQTAMKTKGVGGKADFAYANVVVHRDGSVTGDPRIGNTWAQIDRANEVFQTYCAADVYDSAQLATAIGPVTQALWPVVYEREHWIACVVTEMTHRGVALDIDRTKEILAAAYQRHDEAAAFLATRGVDVNSPKRESMVADAIRAEGVDVPKKRNANGILQDSLDKRAMKKYQAAGSAVAPMFRTLKYAEREITVYCEHYLRTTGTRVHADISASDASTGRMTCKAPNLQNVPESVKPCLRADPGMVLISADFSSVEMRVAAAVTRDPVLMKMYVDPLPEGATEHEIRSRDPYWLIAWEVFGPDATPSDRKTAKIVVLANMYGGGSQKIADQADLDAGFVNEVLAGYRKTFPQLKRWWNDEMDRRIAAGQPYWLLPSGRFQQLDPTRSWAGFNMMIQGLARDLLLGAMRRLQDAGLAENMLLPIHDEILFQVPEEHVDEAVTLIGSVMGTTFEGVPITVEVKCLGSHWTEKSSVPKQKEVGK